MRNKRVSNKFIRFGRVKEVVEGKEAIVLIVPDRMAGVRHRYSVIVMILKAGHVVTGGRELPLNIARDQARTYADHPFN